MIRYKYANGANGRIYDVSSLTDESRNLGSPYKCIGCGNELIPNLGKIRTTKYFSHKSVGSCSPETYLHELAKTTFINTYQDCIKEGKPFYFSLYRPKTCTHFKERMGFECGGRVREKVDLTKIYESALLESNVGEFKPDVALISQRTSPLFIEIAVTHKCSEEKIKSGNKIIEIAVNTEDDIGIINSCHISDAHESIKTYNISGKLKSGDICQGSCKQDVTAVLVYKSGKVRTVSDKPANILALIGNTAYYEVFKESEDPHKSAQFFISKTRELFFKGVPIKNCLVCAHHGIGDTDSIFCRKHKKSTKSNQAAECVDFLPFESKEKCDAAEKRNIEIMKSRTEAMVEKMLSDYKKGRFF